MRRFVIGLVACCAVGPLWSAPAPASRNEKPGLLIVSKRDG